MTQSNSNELRVITYNTHKGFNAGNRQFVLPHIKEALIQAQADFVFLQEVQGEHRHHAKKHFNWPSSNHAAYLAEAHWPYHHYEKNAVYSLGHHGNAILSQYELTNCENINVSNISWASRSLLHATIQHPASSKTIHVICVHLGLTGFERRRQFFLLSKRIMESIPSDSPLIVAGDFNDWTLQAKKRFAHSFELHDAYHSLYHHHARTWPSWLPLLKMDRIFFRGLDLISCDRPTQEGWHRLSDHVPLIATFNVT
jgi:endonuclease/exonuclease/phosphatase family metal-dependent hydrolase